MNLPNVYIDPQAVIRTACSLFGIHEQNFPSDTSSNAEDCRAATFGFLADHTEMSLAGIAKKFHRSRSSVALTIEVHRDRMAMYGLRERQYRALYKVLEEVFDVVEPDHRPSAKVYYVDNFSTHFLREYLNCLSSAEIDTDA